MKRTNNTRKFHLRFLILPFENTPHDCTPQSIFQAFQPYPHHAGLDLRIIYNLAGLSHQCLHSVSATRTFLLTLTHHKQPHNSHSCGCGYDPGFGDCRDGCAHPVPLGLYCMDIGWCSTGNGLMEGRTMVSRIRSSWSRRKDLWNHGSKHTKQ